MNVNHKRDTPKRRYSHTKSGPGRKHAQGDGLKTMKQRAAGAYSRGLRNHFNAKRAAAMAQKRAARAA